MKNLIKLNVLLAKTDSLAANFKGMIKDYSKFFSNNQSSFRGEKRTYVPREGTVDDPSVRKNILIQTTVTEKFQWFKENCSEYINSLFSQERTNSSGVAISTLTVDGDDWGKYTSLELLRLKSIIENGDFIQMVETIPVRSDAEEWNENEEEMYKDRAVYGSPLQEGTLKTTEKESYILPDPNIDKLKNPGDYTPQIGNKTTTIELGDYTFQKFTGEYSHRQRADILRRRSLLLVAVIEALKQCNECESEKSELTSDKIFGYLLG